MGKEIEKKFLVKGSQWKSLAKGTPYRQGYLSTVKERTVRVRTIDEKGFLTIKGITIGISRMEFEYEIPASEAGQMLDKLCEKPLIEKHRYKIGIDDKVWEVDEFHGVNEGLVIAEVELSDEKEEVNIPEWIGAEVSGDPRYYNANLIANPFSNWSD